jgi:hypothetical protein
VGTSFYELGSQEGILILKAAVKVWRKEDKIENDLKVRLKAAVEEWGKKIETQIMKWKMASSNSDINDQLSTFFLQNNSKNKTVVGISAVFYSMAGTKEINQIDENIDLPTNQSDEKSDLPRIKQPSVVAALEKKLKDLLDFEIVDGKYTDSNYYKTKFKNFDIGSGGKVKTYDEKKFLTELANVQLHLIYAKMLYHETATFTLAREWKVHGKPFRTTWSTGWYVTHVPIPATTVISTLH